MLGPMAQDSYIAKVRLFVEHRLGQGQPVPLTSAQSHYLFNVMRLAPGARVALFDGMNGEWQAEVTRAGRGDGSLQCLRQSAPQRDPPDLWLLFAPIRKARTDFIVEKATELGAARILPVRTRFTNAERLRTDRLQAHAVEAAEQCGGTFVPRVEELAPLAQVLRDWDPARRILWADEGAQGAAVSLAGLERGPWAILTGPEGGFAEPERAHLRALSHVVPISLGPRILRADTAAVAALTLWQLHLGDWT